MTLPVGTLSIGDISQEVLGNATARVALTDVLSVTRPVEYPAPPGSGIPMKWYDQNSPAPPAQGGAGWAYYNNDIRNSNCNNTNCPNNNCSDCGNNGTIDCSTLPLVNGVDFTPTPDDHTWLQGNCNCACTFNCTKVSYSYACNCNCPWICACACSLDCW